MLKDKKKTINKIEHRIWRMKYKLENGIKQILELKSINREHQAG